jgi:hypothetical protein
MAPRRPWLIGGLTEKRGQRWVADAENVLLEHITSGGEPAEFVHHSAFGYCGGGPIELMEIVRLVPERIEGPFSGAPDRGFITSPGRYRRHQ